MSNTNPCFNPKTFTPASGALLSLGQWQMLQLYLVDAQNLRLTPQQMPYQNVRDIYIQLNSQAINFHGTVLAQAQGLGNKLYNYGKTANLSFKAVAELMGQSAPNKKAILELLNNLKTTATKYQSDSETVYDGIDSFISDTQVEVTALQSAVKAEVKKIAADKSEILQLQSQYNTDFANKQAAQSKIVSDQKVINDTKYYSWVPFVGTAVAVGEIVAKEKDIKEQVDKIIADVADMQKLTAQMNALNAQVSQLIYSENYNNHMIKEINNAMSGLQLIKGAWGTIVTELGDVINNIDKSAGSALKDQKCLASIYLTTAADEWEQVGDDAETFNLNFYLQPASKNNI